MNKYTKIRILANTEWSVIFYVEDNGNKLVNEFLNKLDNKTQARFIDSIERLRQRNILAREPLVRHLQGKLWELREESDTDIYRIIYFFFTGRRIVLLHGFQKKTQVTPNRGIKLAEKRMLNFLKREGDHNE